uniref:RxLR effector protein n=1 Tax=Phytophthora agathidicida TaxID=1642459 RepID=A0A7G4WI66_9STRA|nr:PaRXLR77 [Phytophthora agathidicida]
MRLRCAVLMGAVVLFTNVNASLVVEDTESAATRFSPRSVASSQTINRFLRTQQLDEDEEEERAFTFKVPGAETISKLMDKPKLASWLKSEQTADDVFMNLKLYKAGDKIFDNPKFLAWAKYVDQYNSKFTGKQTSMLPMLRKAFGTDEALAKALQTATKVESTKAVATKLQTEQLKGWMERGYSTDTMFQFLKLDKFEDNLLGSPGLAVWTRYADEFNPGTKTTLFDTLDKFYRDKEQLSKLITFGTKFESTKKLATDLQKELQLKAWLRNLESPQDIFKVLHLDKGNMFGNPNLKLWIRYLRTFRAENEFARKASLIDSVLDNYHLATLTRMIEKAKMRSDEKAMAVYTEGLLFGRWSAMKKSPRDVSDLLKKAGVTDSTKWVQDYVTHLALKPIN